MNEEKKFIQLEKDLDPYQPILAKASDAILDQEISSYPLFVVHQQLVEIGIPIFEKKEGGPHWSVNVSTLEELAAKQVISMEKVDNFRKIFKDAKKFFCLFVIDEGDAAFVFLNRKTIEN